MTYSLSAACCWIILAAILAALPSNDNHWRRAYFLMALGVPLVVWVFWENGVWAGLLVLAAAGSVFRWPLRYLFAWVLRQVTRRAD
jgi:hypothetical protein